MVIGGLFKKLKDSLTKTRETFATAVRSVLGAGKLEDDVFDRLEETLIRSDMGMETAEEVLSELRSAVTRGEVKTGEDAVPFLKKTLKAKLEGGGTALNWASMPPTVILVTGVNGTGKTTSIAKLARLLKSDGKKVMLAAADTFRAAAVEQLTIWSQRLEIEIVKHQAGSDPAAVAFDAIDAAMARGADVLIIDTAGRLHTQVNLMNELEKIRRVIEKKVPGAPHEALITIDATTGQNGLVQARNFAKTAHVTGIILTKLDGTAKGAVIFAIRRELKIPVKFIGTGEKIEDMAKFNPDEFVDALFD